MFPKPFVLVVLVPATENNYLNKERISKQWIIDKRNYNYPIGLHIQYLKLVKKMNQETSDIVNYSKFGKIDFN
jgi:hypothetical protein